MLHRLACADFTFPLLTHDQSLKLVAMLGFEGVDIGLFEERSHLWPSRVFANTASNARNLKSKLDDCGLRAADIFLQTALDFTPYAVNHPDDDHRDRARDWFLHTLDYAAECESGHVTALPGVHFETEPYETSFSRTVDELTWRVDQSAERGITFGVEPHYGSLVPDPGSAGRLVSEIPGLTLTLDYTHFTYIGLPDVDVEPLLSHASHFHVRGARKERLQASFAENVIDYERIYEAMVGCRYDGWIGIEYVWSDWEHMNECDNISETVQFRDLFRRLIGTT